MYDLQRRFYCQRKDVNVPTVPRLLDRRLLYEHDFLNARQKPWGGR
jgi:hypothetical protein